MVNKKFARLRITIAAVLICTAVSEMPLKAEFVFLKDGSIVEGAIISDAANSVTLRQSDKKIKQIPRNDIMRIL